MLIIWNVLLLSLPRPLGGDSLPHTTTPSNPHVVVLSPASGEVIGVGEQMLVEWKVVGYLMGQRENVQVTLIVSGRKIFESVGTKR